jgi:hypothetical protein
LPIGLVMYVMGTPARRRAIKAREQTDANAGAQPSGLISSASSGLRPEDSAPTGSGVAPDVTGSGVAPDADREAPADPVAPVRKEA